MGDCACASRGWVSSIPARGGLCGSLGVALLCFALLRSPSLSGFSVEGNGDEIVVIGGVLFTLRYTLKVHA